MPHVCVVIGTSYCGSSLFNALLATQPAIAALGEVTNVVRPDKGVYCAACHGRAPEDCRLFDKLVPGSKENFHKFLWTECKERWPETKVLINTSKVWKLCLHSPRIPPDYDVDVILLAKTPHEFAYSFMAHQRRLQRHQEWSIELIMRRWANIYTHALGMVEKCREMDKWAGHPVAAMLHGLRSPNILAISYLDLVRNPACTVERVCEHLGVPFNADVIATWPEPANCMVGGNRAIYAQLTGNESFFTGQGHEYLGGKYTGKSGKIFIDKRWKGDRKFRLVAGDAYFAARDVLDEPLKAMNMLPAYQYMDWMRGDDFDT